MKNLASDLPSQYTIDLHPSSLCNRSNAKKKRCKSVDSFNFLMCIIENERYADRARGKVISSEATLRDRESWKSDFYKDEYDIEEDN